MRKISLLIVGLFWLQNLVMAQTTYYSRQNGDWNDVNTWSTISHLGAAAATTPGNAVDDIVLIGSNHTVTYNDNVTIGNMTVDDDGLNGVLRFPFTNGAGINGTYTLTVSGNVTVSSNGQILSVEGGSGTPVLPGSPRNRTHTLNIGGDLTNTGTFDLQASATNRIVNLTFNGSANQTISGEGTYDTYEVAYNNSGTAPTNRVTNSSVNFTNSIGGDRSTFTAGTYVHNNTAIYTGEDNGGFTINTSIEILNGTFDMIVNHTNDRTGTINGDLTITGGTFNGGASGVGTGTITNLILNGTLTISSTGLLNIGDGDGTATNRPTDGTLTINGTGSTINGTSCFTHDLTLSAGTDLIVSNSATLSVGRTTGLGNGTGSVVLNGGTGNGSSLVINDAGTNFDMFGQQFDLNEECTFTVNNGTIDIGENVTAAPELLELNQSGAQVAINGGTVNILTATTTTNARGVAFDAGNTSFTVTGGTVNIGNPTSGEGSIRFRTATGTCTFNVSGGVVNIQDNFEKNNAAAVVNITVSNGATLNVGTGSGAGVTQSEIGDGTESTLTINGAGTTVTFGRNVLLGNVNLNDAAPFTAGNNAGVTARSEIRGAFVSSGASTVTFGSGLTISATGSHTMSSGLLDIEPLITTASDTRLIIDGDLTQNGGTIEVGKSITTITAGNLIQLRDGGSVLINTGTFNVLSNVGLTSISNNNPFNLNNNGSGNEVLTIGDGAGGASSAILSIAPNLAAELPTPSTRNILDVDGANAIVTLNSDGLLQIGGGNIGNFRLNTSGAQFVMSGGTCNVTASFTVDSGTSATISGGTLNVGTADSNGNNRLIYVANPNAVTRVIISGGTVNVGDGNSTFDIGNNNNNPVFGSANYSSLEISGTGILNLNGGFRLRDANARFLMTGGEFNLNPVGSQNLLGTSDILYLEQGIVDFTGGTVTIINPNANTGSGVALRISPQGNPASGDFLSGIAAFPSVVDFSGSTFRFGDGSASETGSSEGFDVNIDDSHTYGTFVVNNPTGDNRFVEITNSGNSYQLSGDLTVTAGILDINDNSIDRDVAGGTFTLGASGHLRIGNANGLNHFPGSSTAFSTYSLDINSIVEYDGAGAASVDIPGVAQFGFLTISGTGSKTLSAAESVRSTLTLSGGTFVASTNLTMESGSRILRTNTDVSGIMTGTVQGANAYIIEYIGNDKTTQMPEWSGAGNQSMVVNLTDGQTLTQHTGLIAEGDVTINSGIFADGGNTLTVNGNVSNSSTHIGTGKILITGGAAIHTISGDGTGIFQNLELDDATNNAIFTAGQTVNGTLTLTNGVLNIDTYSLNIGSAGSVSVTSPDQNKMIQVEGTVVATGVTKTYTGTGSFTWPIGVTGKYTPATINVTSTGTGGTITVKPVNSASPFTSDAADLELNYYWSVSNTGFSDVTATHSYTYVDADVQGNETGFIPARYVPVTWTSISDISLVNTITNVISFPAVNYLNGDFTAGEPSEFGVVLTYYSTNAGGTSNWDQATSWSTSAINGPVASTIPGSNRPVFIGGGNTIIANTSNLGAASLELQSDGTLEVADGTTGHTFGTVVGSGTLRIISNSTTSPEFPGGSYTDFLGSSGGTVEYSGSGTYTLPSSPVTLHNLTISGSGGSKTFPDADFTLSGNLSVSGSATALISSTTAGNISAAGDLNVNSATATLRLPDGTARTIDVSGDLSNEGTIDVASTGTTLHNLSVGGNFTNNNIFDFNTTGSDADITFTGSTNATLSGSGATTDFNRLIINKGTSQTPELEVTSTNFTLSGPTNGATKALEIQNGTFKLSAAHTITLSSGGADYSLPATGRLWVNDASAQADITSASNNLSLAGTLQISDGAVNIGDDATGVQDNDVVYVTGSPAITIEGGTLTVGGAIRGNPTSTAIDYNQSGGTVIVSNNKSLTGNSGVLGDFAITNAGSSFTMSNGTIRVRRNNATAQGIGFRIISGVTHSVTGGTVEIITNSTVTNRQIQVTSGAPFWNLNIGDGSGNCDVGTTNSGEQDFVVLNDFTMNTDANFKLYRASGGNPLQDDVDLSVRGNFTITNGTFLSGNPSTTTFNGISGTQTITGSATFYHVEINNTGTSAQLASGTDLTIEGDWTTTAGTFDAATNSRKVTFNGTVAQTLSGQPTSFYDLELNNANGLTVSSSSAEVTNQLTLTSGILDIGSNSLLLTNTASTAIQGTFSATNMIQTDGSNSASSITKSFPTLNNETFVFPLGTGGGYRPVTLTVTAANGATGTINVIPVASQHPSAPTNSLNYYWLVSTTGFGGNPSITHNYQYLQGTDLTSGSEANYLDATFNGTTWTEGNTGNVDDSNDQINTTSTGALSGQAYTAGESPFTNPLIYYSRNATSGGNWGTASTWSTTSHAGGAAAMPPGSANPVIVANTHTVTIQDGTAAQSASTQIDAGGTIDAIEEDISQLGTVSGGGILKLSPATALTPTLPSLDAGFTASGGGTIEYASNNDYDLPAQTTYNNLTLSGSGTKTLANNISVNGNFTLNDGSFDLNAFTANRTTSGGTFTMLASTTLQTGEGDNFPGNYTTYSLDVTSTVNYDGTDNLEIVSDLNGASYGNLTISKSTGGATVTKTLGGNIDVNGALTISRRVQLAASTFNIDLAGLWYRDARNNSAFVPGTGTVTFDGTGSQNIQVDRQNEPEVFYNLEINNAAGVATFDNITQLTVNNNLTLTSGTLNLNSDPLLVGGNLINNTGNADAITNQGTVTFNSVVSNQSLTGATNFNNLTVAKASGLTLTLNNAVTVSGVLNMQNDGNIVLTGSGNDLTIGTAGSITGTFGVSRMIVTGGTTTGSALIKNGTATANSLDFTFPVGVGSSYTPVVIDASAVNAAGNLTIRSVTGSNANLSGDASKALNRYFLVDLSGGLNDITATFNFTYTDADVQGTEVNYISRYWNGSNWIQPSNDFVTPASNQFGSNGGGTNVTVTSSEWIAGEPGAIFPKLYSINSGNWSTLSNWNSQPDGLGSTPSSPPNADNEVEIQAAHTITIAVGNQSASDLTINGVLDLGTTTGHTFGPIDGTGTLSLAGGTFPTYTTLATTFFDAGQGTVEYNGASSYTLPSSPLIYNNLIISGGNTKTLGAITTVLGNLTIDGSTLDADNTLNYSLTLGGSLSTPNSGTLEPRQGTFTLNGAGAQSLPSLTFFNLAFDNTGSKTINSSISVNNFTIQGASGIVNAGANNIDISGNWSNSAGSSGFSNTGTVTFNNTLAAQTVAGTTTFGILTVNKTAQTLNITGNNNATTGNFNITSGNVALGTNNFTIGGNFNNGAGTGFTSSSPSTITFNGSGAQGVSNAVTFQSLTIDGSNPFTFSSLITVNENLTINSGTLTSASGSLDLSGSITVESGATFNASNINPISLEGDFIDNGGTTTLAGSGTVTFDGAAAQALTGSFAFNNLTKNGADDLTLTGSSTISGTLTLTDGNIITTPTDLFTLNASSSSVSGASTTSHVNGVLAYTVPDNNPYTGLVYPLGDGTNYRPLTLSVTQTGTPTSRTYTTQIFSGPPSGRTLTGGLTNVSAIRYYNITQSSPAAVASATVRIDYGEDDDVSTNAPDLADLRIAKSDGSGNWVNIGGTGSATPAGFITSTSFTTFSDFVLASLTFSNPLPVELLDFSARLDNSKVVLDWSTASELNNDFFEVHRSENGENWEVIGKVAGNGTTNGIINYNYEDRSPFFGELFYRLKQVDFDGQFEYSNVVSVKNEFSGPNMEAFIFPNPALPNMVHLRVSTANKENKIGLKIINMAGETFYTKLCDPEYFATERLLDIPREMKSGIYVLIIEQGEQMFKKKIIIL